MARRVSDTTIESNQVQSSLGLSGLMIAKKVATSYNKKRKDKKGFITEDRDAPEDYLGI